MIEQKVGEGDNALQLKATLVRMNLPIGLIDAAIASAERSYVELKKDLSGRYYSGCCI